MKNISKALQSLHDYPGYSIKTFAPFSYASINLLNAVNEHHQILRI